MTRNRLNLSYISDHTARKSTLKQRKKGLMKKLDELKILCDIEGCAIIYDPLTSIPEAWPSNLEVHNVIQKFEMMTETGKMLRSVNHNEFLTQQIAKAEKQNKKLIEDNKEKFMKELMFTCLGGGNMDYWNVNNNDLINLCEFIDQYLKYLFHHRKVLLQNQYFEIGESSSVMAMERDIAPTTMTQASFSSFLSPPIKSLHLTNEFQSIVTSNQRPEQVNSQLTNGSVVSSNHGPEHVHSHVNSLVDAIIFNSPQVANEIPSNVDSLASNLVPNSDQEVYIPVMTQDEEYSPTPNLNENQQYGFVEKMMKLSEQTKFPWMEEIHNHH